MTNNPKKMDAMKTYGINVVDRESIEMPSDKTSLENVTYLKTKRDKLGHLLSIEA